MWFILASAVSYSGITNRKTSLNTFTPAKILPSPFSHSASKKAADRASVGKYFIQINFKSVLKKIA